MGPEVDLGLGWADRFDLATAFVTPAALERLDDALRRARESDRALTVRLLFGVYQRFTPPEALARMLRLQRDYPGTFFAKVARNERFHWKLYIFGRQSARRIYVGSANFTQDGLGAEGELTLKISASARDPISRSLQAEFENLWGGEDALPLSSSLLGRYKKVGRPPAVYTRPEKDAALRRLLRRPKRLPPPRRATDVKPRVCFIDSFTSDETATIVAAETNWRRNGWDYLSYRTKAGFDRDLTAHLLLMVTSDSPGLPYKVEFVRVRDTAELTTPDGKYFIAYSRVPNAWRRPYAEIKRDLKGIGLGWEKIKTSPALTRSQLAEISRLLHIKLEKLYQG